MERAVRELNALGYSCDVILLDARHFLPQSRPRVFLVGATDAPRSVPQLAATQARPAWALAFAERHPGLRLHAYPLPSPPGGPAPLASYIEAIPPDDPSWWDRDRVTRFLESLSPVQTRRLDLMRSAGGKTWRTAYRRTRHRRAVWEIRRDAIAGCLRTARGGSSKQALVEIDTGAVRVRWMTAREYGNLMGAPADYRLPGRRTQALFGFGDAVCVPAIQWLCESYLVPLAERDSAGLLEAA